MDRMKREPNRSAASRLLRVTLLACATVIAAGSCTGGALNPSFLALILDPETAQEVATIPNAPGHVVVTMVNNTVFDEALLNYLAPQLGLTEQEAQELVPRIRMRVQITYLDGSSQTLELIEGTPGIVQPGFDATSEPDLNENTLPNVVAICDVSIVEVEPGSNVEVFIPVEMTGFELVEVEENGTVSTEFQPRVNIPPRFTALEVDTVDQDGNTVIRRNVSARDVPVPTTNVLCGSVIAITISGALSVPFTVDPSEPSFDIGDLVTVEGIGGRYDFEVSIQ